MSRNARSRRYKQRHGIAPGHGPMHLWTKPCNQCFGAINRLAASLPLPRFKSKTILSRQENAS